MIKYTVYKTVNKANGKFYLGVHKTSNPMDEYLGSGTYIQRAVKKYGVQGFTKEILFEFDTQEEAWEKENDLVELYHTDPLCKNLRKGGSGGFDYINHNGLAVVGRYKGIQSIQELAKSNPDRFQAIWSTAGSKGAQDPRAVAALLSTDHRAFFGRKHKSTSLELMSKRAKERLISFNPSVGSIWITNGVTNKKVKRLEDIPEGWKRGKHERRRLASITSSPSE